MKLLFPLNCEDKGIIGTSSIINKAFFVIADYSKKSYYVTRVERSRRQCRGQGRFVCDNCNRRYHHVKNLRRHVANECGKQPMYQCTYCPYKATYKSYLHVHMMKHAKKNFSPRMYVFKQSHPWDSYFCSSKLIIIFFGVVSLKTTL